MIIHIKQIGTRVALLFLTGILIVVCFSNTIIAANSSPRQPGFKVVAYMPAWTGNVADIPFKNITHINYAFIRPTATGNLTPVENIQKLQDIVLKAHAIGTLVGISVGGWDNLKNDDFEAMAAKAESRAIFINNVVSLLQQYQLDGVDIDWEYPSNANDQSNFATLLTELGNGVRAKGKYLSAAVAADGAYADGVQQSVFSAVDFLNLLAYDGGPDLDHSPFNYAAASLTYWTKRGLPSNKAVLGIPFHARPTWKSYKTVVAEGANPNTDVHNGNYFNGIYTVVQKTDLAFDRNIGGIMISNLSQDASGSNSLVSALSNVIARRSPALAIQAPYEKVHNIPGEIEAEQYDMGGEGLGYHDLTVGNAGGTFRYDNVDVEANGAGNHKITGVETGEWLNYTVNVTTAGALTIYARVSSVYENKTFHIELNGIDVTGKMVVPNTNGWQNWQTVVATTSYLPQGRKVLRIVMDSGDFAIDKIAFQALHTSTTEAKIDEEAVEISGLTLHPNPGYTGYAQKITLTFEAVQRDLSVSVNDINGYRVFSQQYGSVDGSSLDIALPSLSPGLYTVRVQGNQKSWTSKYMVK